jgi:hypothetical protein
MIYVHQHCVDIREGNIEEDREGKVRCQLRTIWCHGMFGSARVNQQPPVHHAGWMDDGWVDRCMDDENKFLLGGCFHVSYPTTVVNYVLNIHMHQPT